MRAPAADLASVRGAALGPGSLLLGGRFRVLRRLGAGGMGIVYEAHDSVRRSSVAIKLMASLEAGGIYRLKNEFRALADVVHPNLVRLHELFCDGAQWFFSMDLIEGVPFDRWVRPNGVLEEARLRAVLPQCVLAVQAIHAAGKLHRDLKPSNVLVTDSGQAIVLDFGLSADPELGGQGQTTHDGSVSGTPAYMAPEQAASEQATPASDFYALGVMLFEALTGRWPFQGASGAVIAAKQRDAAPRASSIDASVPSDLDALCAQLLERAPGDRPSGSALCAALGCTPPPSKPLSIPPGLASIPPGAPGAVPPDRELIGRDAELDRLAQALARAIAGQPQAVIVSGESGMGKSALVDAFLTRLRAQHIGCVLGGRCNERESVPFKGFDAVVDALSRYMRRLSRDAAALLPRDAFALAKIFPILQRIDVIAEAPQRALASLDELRPRAFAAFVELLGRIRDREPLVIAIDDVQWVDRDSIALLRELLMNADPVPLLLVVCHRSARGPSTDPAAGKHAHDEEPELLTELLDLLDLASKQHKPLQIERIALQPLPFEAAQRLAQKLLGSNSDRELARAVASEAGGSPFFIGELTTHARRMPSELPATLDETIAERVTRLPEAARALLEVLAVAGRPLAVETALQAATAGHDAIDALKADRFARSAETGRATDVKSPQRTLECYHDRIRESVSRMLSDRTLQATHARIARVLVEEPEPDLEHLATHFEGALEDVLAAQYAAAAAERASQKLAYDRAAELYERALRLGHFDVERKKQLSLARGQALAHAGRNDAAAAIYLDALRGASDSEAPQLRERAAEQLMLSAQVDRVVEQLDALLQSQKLPKLNLARSPIPALLFWRAALRLRGFRYTLKPDAEIDESSLRLLDVYWSCAIGLAQIDLIRSAEFSARHLWLALSSGSATHIGRGFAYESSVAGGTGRRQNYARAAEVLGHAQRLAERTHDPYLRACTAQWSGVNALNAGRYMDAVADSEHALSIYREHRRDASSRKDPRGTAWEIMITEMFLLWALWALGRFERCSEWLRSNIEQPGRGELARGRDLPAVMKTFFALIWIGRNDVVAAKNAVALGERAPDDTRSYSFPDFMRFCVACMIDWYCDDIESAWQRTEAAWPRMRHAPIMRNVSTRISVYYCRAGSALLALRMTPPGSRKHAALLRAATLAQRDLESGNNAVGHAWAHVIAAGLACARGERPEAITETRAALAAFEAQSAGMYAAAAKRRLGVLMSGPDGAALVAQADEALRAEGLVSPERITSMLVPAVEILRSSVADAYMRR